MNSGAIEFLEYKWVSMNKDKAIDLMVWLESNLEPGYTIYKTFDEKMFFIGESKTLFDNLVFNQKYPIYEIEEHGTEFKLNKTLSTFNT